MKYFYLFCCLVWGALGWVPLASSATWKEHKGQHFIIYYNDTPEDFVESVEKAAEQYYDEITENLGYTRYKSWSWDERAKIYIYDSREDYVSKAQQAQWSHGAASARNKEIHTFPQAHGFFDSTLPHELGHIIFREFVGLEAQVPLWLEEGVAMYQEKAKRYGAHDLVRRAAEQGVFLSLMEMDRLRLYNKSDVDLVELFYLESASIVYYMIQELGQYRFVNLCKALRDGKDFNEALEEAYVRFHDLDDLNKSWVEYLQNKP